MKAPNGFFLVAAALALGTSSANSPGCTEVSVEGDATYCFSGPTCSGAGTAPAGPLCPKKGDVAIKDCLNILKSYTDGDKCVAQLDATCAKIKTGAWGCVWGNTATKATPCPGVPGWEKDTPSPKPCTAIPGWEWPSGASSCPGIPGWQKGSTVNTPCTGIPGWEKLAAPPSTSGPVIHGWEKPTPALSTPCPVIPARLGKANSDTFNTMPGDPWLGETNSSSFHAVPGDHRRPHPSPILTLPGWEKLSETWVGPAPSTTTPSSTSTTVVPTTVTLTSPTQAPGVPTSTPTISIPTNAPTTNAPAITVEAVQLSAAETTSTNTWGNSHTSAIGAAIVGAVAAIAVAAFVFRERQITEIANLDSPTTYNGAVQTPV